jgi:ribosomal protein S13
VRVDVNKRAGELTEEECTKITKCIEDPIAHGIPKYLFNR